MNEQELYRAVHILSSVCTHGVTGPVYVSGVATFDDLRGMFARVAAISTCDVVGRTAIRIYDRLPEFPGSVSFTIGADIDGIYIQHMKRI